MLENWLELQKFTKQVNTELERSLSQMVPAVTVNEFYVVTFFRTKCGT